MVGILWKKLFGDEKSTEEAKRQIIGEIATRIDVYKAAGLGLIDDVIDPRDTRRDDRLGSGASQEQAGRAPKRRRGIIPV